MLVDSCKGVIVKLRRNLLEAWRVAVLFRVVREVGENLPLAFCERHIPFRPFSAAGFENVPVGFFLPNICRIPTLAEDRPKRKLFLPGPRRAELSAS